MQKDGCNGSNYDIQIVGANHNKGYGHSIKKTLFSDDNNQYKMTYRW